MQVAPSVAPLAESCPIEAVSNIIALANPAQIEVAPASPGASEDKANDPNYFKFEGRWYQLYKRTEGRDASYFCRFNFDGKTHKQSTGTNQREVAIARAKQWIGKVRAGKWQDVEKLKLRQTAATVRKVVELYRPETGTGIAGISELAARNNVWALGKILKTGLGVKEPLDVSLNSVNKALVAAFQDAMVKLYAERTAKDAEAQRSAREQALRSSRSIVHQARSLFNQRTELPRKYEAAGLKIPSCVSEFMKCKLLGRDIKREYLPPADEIVQKAFVEIEKLKESDPQSYRAFWLATGAGLRRGEILRARWEHFITRDGAIWYSGGIGKDGQVIEVPVQDRAWAALSPFRPVDGQGPVMGEGASIEYARRINWWMKQQGWNTEKKLHELRAYIGSRIYLKNPVAAMKFLRHKTIKMTEQFYARYGTVQTPQVL